MFAPNKRFQVDAKTYAFLYYSLRSNNTKKRYGFGAAEAGFMHCVDSSWRLRKDEQKRF